MTHEDDFIQQLEGYLDEYEGTTPLPDEVRDAVRAQLRTTRQIGPITGPMRDFMMSNVIRVGLVAAAAAIIAVIAFNLLPGSPDRRAASKRRRRSRRPPQPPPLRRSRRSAARIPSIRVAIKWWAPGLASMSRSPFPPAGAPAETGW